MTNVDMGRIDVVDAAGFAELAANRKVLPFEESEAEIFESGYECHLESTTGGSWPSCGCAMRFECCGTMHRVKCDGEDKYVVVNDKSGCIPYAAAPIETACDTREDGAYRPFDPHPGGLTMREVEFWRDPVARKRARDRQRGFETMLGDMVRKGLVDVVDLTDPEPVPPDCKVCGVRMVYDPGEAGVGIQPGWECHANGCGSFDMSGNWTDG